MDDGIPSSRSGKNFKWLKQRIRWVHFGILISVAAWHIIYQYQATEVFVDSSDASSPSLSSSVDYCPDLPVFGQPFNVSQVSEEQKLAQERTDLLVPSNQSISFFSASSTAQSFTENGIPSYKYGKNDRPTGLRIAFLGDSVTRYQAVSFIHYLHTGYWIEDNMVPNELQERMFSSWQDYYHRSVEYFGAEHILCDCYRLDDKEKFKTIVENRYYSDVCRDNYVYIFNRYGRVPFRGHYTPETVNAWRRDDSLSTDQLSNRKTTLSGTPLLPRPTALDHEVVNSSFAWRNTNWVRIIEDQLAKLEPRPDYVVINQGLWKYHGLNGRWLVQIRQALDRVGMIGIYKTTTKLSDDKDTSLLQHDAKGCSLLHYCFDLSWTAGLSGNTTYWDGIHFLPHVNTRFNELLLDMLHDIRQT